VEQAKKDKKKPEEMPKNALGIMDLANGKVEVVNDVKSFRLPDEGGKYLAYQMEKIEEKKEDGANSANAQGSGEKGEDQARRPPQRPSGGSPNSRDLGTDLVLRDLVTGNKTVIPEVATYQWNKNGAWLLYTINSKTKADNGVYVWNSANGSKTELLKGVGKYQALLFDDNGDQAAFLSDRDDATEKGKAAEAKRAANKSEQGAEAKPEEPRPIEAQSTEAKPEENPDPNPNIFKLYFWRVEMDSATEIVAPGTTGLPDGWNVSEHGNLSFSKDGKRLFLGTAPIPKTTTKDAPEPMKVDIWHWQDPELQTVQRVRAEADKNRNYRAVLHIDNGRLVQLAAEDMTNVQTNDNSRYGLGTDNREYRLASTWDTMHNDVYSVDLQTGTKRQLFKALRFGASLSPEGKYAITFDATAQKWLAASTDDGSVRDLTGGIKAVFHNEESDTPEPPRSYGIAGWTKGDTEVFLYDKFDIWAINPATGASRQVTQGHGRRQSLTFRYINLDSDLTWIPSDKPLYLSAINTENKATGFFRATFQGGEPQSLIFADKLLSGLTKAKNADVVSFTQQTFVEFPDLWISGLDFLRPQKISSANPQQAQYRWGTQEIIEYVNSDGKVLKALLAKPDDFDPSKKYPMMVYIYEGMTDGQYRYVTPAPGQNINVTRFVSNGYLVLRPDIVYDIGYPGKSAMKCVLPAIEQVAAKGYVDRERIGIQGHSWGGYQITYMITQTNMFRAVEAGASVSNMISAYGGIRYGTGVSRQFQYERTQSRIGGTPWTKPMQFIENSPIFFAENVQTPYLTIHNDQDDAVPYTQAIEFFTALRRLGKEAYFFNYNGQLHGLRDHDMLKHFTVHLCEFFDHYLLGAPRPDWMISPTPYLERGKRDVSEMFKAKQKP
jgi:dipeptidyl aminopeptidase/acylaminoacyl peptidase